MTIRDIEEQYRLVARKLADRAGFSVGVWANVNLLPSGAFVEAAIWIPREAIDLRPEASDAHA